MSILGPIHDRMCSYLLGLAVSLGKIGIEGDMRLWRMLRGLVMSEMRVLSCGPYVPDTSRG
jgi:hypothetical protein